MRKTVEFLRYFGLWQLFMVLEDSFQHALNLCQPYPPPIVALHLHLPHTLYCLTRIKGELYAIPRLGLSDHLFAIEPFTPIYELSFWGARLLGLLNLLLVSWAVYSNFRGWRTGGKEKLSAVTAGVAISLAVAALFGQPYS